MKFSVLFLFFVFAQLMSFSQTQNVSNEKPQLILSGTIKEISAEEISPNSDSSTYITYIDLNLTLENKSSTAIILLQKELETYDAVVIEPTDEDIKSEDYFLNRIVDNVYLKTPSFRSSFAMKSQEWKQLKKELNQKMPPKDKTFILLPNQKLEVDGFTRFNIPKVRDEWAIGRIPNRNLSFLKESKDAKLILHCETWSILPILRKDKKKLEKQSVKDEFVQKLREKWSKFGYLYTEHIYSQPISINFNSIIFKTLID